MSIQKKLKDLNNNSSLSDKEVAILKSWRDQAIAKFAQIDNKLDLAVVKFAYIDDKLLLARDEIISLRARVKALEDAQ